MAFYICHDTFITGNTDVNLKKKAFRKNYQSIKSGKDETLDVKPQNLRNEKLSETTIREREHKTECSTNAVRSTEVLNEKSLNTQYVVKVETIEYVTLPLPKKGAKS